MTGMRWSDTIIANRAIPQRVLRQPLQGWRTGRHADDLELLAEVSSEIARDRTQDRRIVVDDHDHRLGHRVRLFADRQGLGRQG